MSDSDSPVPLSCVKGGGNGERKTDRQTEEQTPQCKKVSAEKLVVPGEGHRARIYKGRP